MLLTIFGWKPNATTGIIEYTVLAESGDDLGFATTLAAGASIVSANEIVNTLGYHGYHVILAVAHDVGAAVGHIALYADEGSVTGELQSDRNGYQDDPAAHGMRSPGICLWDPNATDDDVQSSKVMKM
ncbi:unnamed protein product [marine sediment metagenome]|uniref:Uncharacterized protein n=1 Tax=marine sediment metagenome TaxID=412755 RepID=X0UT43_9ZZZZ